MSTPRRTQATPQLTGLPKEAADELRQLAQTVHRLNARLGAMEGAGYLTSQQADARYSPPVMARELSASGSAPLNVMAIAGRLVLEAQPVRKRR